MVVEIRKYFNGLVLVAVLTILAVYMQNATLFKSLSLSAIIIAILLGMLINNTIGIKESMEAGIKLCSKKVLRLAIILLGFKLSLLEVSKLGFKAVIIILIVTSVTLIFTRYIGKKMNISRSLSILIATGTSICGASAIIAVNAVTNSDNEEDVPFAVGVVTIFGTVFMLLYPVIFHILHLNTMFYSLWAGSSIHEVAQVVAAGFSVSNQAGTFATVVKLTRVLLIVPITILLSIRQSGRENSDKCSFENITIPWFVLMFLGVIIINSLGILPGNISKGFITIDNYLMTAAMVSLGLETSLLGMKKVGLKPIYLGAISSVFISIFSLITIFLLK